MMYEMSIVAQTPPMGWNSWDCYAATVNEEQLLGNAMYMAKHLKQHGWEYVVCDIQWYEPLAGTENTEYRPFAKLHMDEFCRLLPADNRFPSATGEKGFAPIADKIHKMGLKFGVHIMRGIPRQAVHKRMHIMGKKWTADEIADPSSICKWNSDMYGLRADHPGSQVYYNSLFTLYASWGVDYIKVDDIANTNILPNNPYSAKHEIEMIKNAIDNCGRPMVLSLSPGPAPINEAWHLQKHCNMWRMT
ncbi:MAG: glycoside hydrolase family 27 protein, partial [Oscillospiraceae bacterium]|nr:glycoside hydrolase family 27 protein [Oscillospiraceae bacterium]